MLQISARWDSVEACRPIVDEAPMFYPNIKEFEDTLGYIAKIRSQAEPYGICRIVPPACWVPPCPLQEKDLWENAKFPTRIQQIDLLQNREPIRKKIRGRKRKCRKQSKMGMGTRIAKSGFEANVASEPEEKFGFQSGSDFTLKDFQQYANVYYEADLETRSLGSGFPKTSSLTKNESDRYALSGWNLNKFPRLPGSALCFEGSDISGVVVPGLYDGMCFPSFCWVSSENYIFSV
ncbi:putative lysine-specific demethylase JMJ14 [Glycine soja]